MYSPRTWYPVQEDLNLQGNLNFTTDAITRTAHSTTQLTLTVALTPANHKNNTTTASNTQGPIPYVH